MDQASEEESSNKPKNRPYYQQTMRSWSPLLTPWRAAGSYLLIGLIFVPLGAVFWQDSDIVELKYQYDGADSDGDSCKISDYKANLTCEISFEVEEDIPGPVYVFYELTNFYQNHETYVSSVSQDQLLGSTSTSDVSTDCDPLVYNGTLVLHPCGLIANSLFNDVYTVTSGQDMVETDIAWDSDVADKFVQPDGFVTAACTTGECATCLDDAGYTDSGGGTSFDGCGITDDTAYYYPNEDTTQYLYETFPEVISPLQGVKDEHFIVWMRTSGSSSFRKLYGRIEAGLEAGDTLTFSVRNNFIVDYYDGTKSIVVSNTNDLGGRNLYWGQSLTTIGVIVLLLALLIAVKQRVWPRTMGDYRKLLDDT